MSIPTGPNWPFKYLISGRVAKIFMITVTMAEAETLGVGVMGRDKIGQKKKRQKQTRLKSRRIEFYPETEEENRIKNIWGWHE